MIPRAEARHRFAAERRASPMDRSPPPTVPSLMPRLEDDLARLVGIPVSGAHRLSPRCARIPPDERRSTTLLVPSVTPVVAVVA
jgi:hypothetical protein